MGTAPPFIHNFGCLYTLLPSFSHSFVCYGHSAPFHALHWPLSSLGTEYLTKEDGKLPYFGYMSVCCRATYSFLPKTVWGLINVICYTLKHAHDPYQSFPFIVKTLSQQSISQKSLDRMPKLKPFPHPWNHSPWASAVIGLTLITWLWCRRVEPKPYLACLSWDFGSTLDHDKGLVLILLYKSNWAFASRLLFTRLKESGA